MSNTYIRIYQSMDISAVKEHMIIYGDLSASCSKCNALNVKFGANNCPECSTEFKYISFRNVKTNMPKLKKIAAERPSLVIVDFDDFKRISAEQKAKEFLK